MRNEIIAQARVPVSTEARHHSVWCAASRDERIVVGQDLRSDCWVCSLMKFEYTLANTLGAQRRSFKHISTKTENEKKAVGESG